MTVQLKQTEAQFERAVVELAELNGWLTYHTRDSRRSNPGFPDLVLVRRSRLVFAELKTDKGRVSDSQAHWLDVLSQVEEVEVGVWRPRMWDSIVRDLR